MFWLILGIVVFVALTSVSWWVSTYNFFMSAKVAIDTQWSNIITEYERRVDLFVNLAKTVKSFKEHEKETLVQIAQARGGLRSGDKTSQRRSMAVLDGIIGRMMTYVEAYPELKSMELHADLFNEIRITEDRINAARTGYNSIVQEYNNSVVTFPSNIIARSYGIIKSEFYTTSRKDVMAAPSVEL